MPSPLPYQLYLYLKTFILSEEYSESNPVQKEGFDTTESPGVIGITAYVHDQLQEEIFFPFLQALLYLHAREHLGPKALTWYQKRPLMQCTVDFRYAPTPLKSAGIFLHLPSG